MTCICGGDRCVFQTVEYNHLELSLTLIQAILGIPKWSTCRYSPKYVGSQVKIHKGYTHIPQDTWMGLHPGELSPVEG